MNAKLKWILAFVLLVALLLWLWLQDKEQKKAAVPKSEVPTSSSVKPLAASHEPEKSESNEAGTYSEAMPDDEVMEGKTVRSYLVVYRDQVLARDCSDIYREHHWDDQSKDEIFDNLHRYALNNESTLINTQEIFNKFYDRCMDLATQVKQRDHSESWKFDYASPALKALSKELTTAPTVNITEERFKKLVEFKHKLNETFSLWFQASLGKYKLNRSERKAISEQIKAISESIHQLGYGPEFDHQRESLDEQMHALMEKTKQRMPPDEARINQLSAYHQQLTERLWPSLTSRHVGAFILVFNALNNQSHGPFLIKVSETETFELERARRTPELITVSQVLYEASPFKHNKAYFDVVAEAAGWLYLCELGLDCSESSIITRNYCLAMNNLSRNSNACGLDVMTFLKTHYISPNLWPDVLAMVETIRGVVNG